MRVLRYCESLQIDVVRCFPAQIGPRIDFKLIKVEEGVCNGAVRGPRGDFV